VFVGLGCGQSGDGIQLDQIIFEHAFNIWLESDTFLRFSASRPTDNTSLIETTLVAADGWFADVLHRKGSQLTGCGPSRRLATDL
jgi:hypothetical protein